LHGFCAVAFTPVFFVAYKNHNISYTVFPVNTVKAAVADIMAAIYNFNRKPVRIFKSRNRIKPFELFVQCRGIRDAGLQISSYFGVVAVTKLKAYIFFPVFSQSYQFSVKHYKSSFGEALCCGLKTLNPYILYYPQKYYCIYLKEFHTKRIIWIKWEIKPCQFVCFTEYKWHSIKYYFCRIF
jgi:hypothetical protein